MSQLKILENSLVRVTLGYFVVVCMRVKSIIDFCLSLLPKAPAEQLASLGMSLRLLLLFAWRCVIRGQFFALFI